MADGGAYAQRVFRSATSGRNVDLRGPRLSGRSHVLGLVEREYARAGFTTVTVRGVGEQLSLAALRSALADSADLAGPGTAAPARLTGALVERRPAAILVDDADRLDRASWEAVVLAHRTGAIPLIAVVPAGSSPADPRSLARLAPPVRVELQPLTLDDVHDVLQHRLEGPVAPTLASRVHTKSGGRWGLVAAIADSALIEGRIRRIDGVWTDQPDLWSEGLVPVYEALLSDADPTAAEALEALALAGVVEAGTAARLVGDEVLDGLERAGLVRSFAVGADLRVSVEPPGITDYVVHRPPSARRERLLRSVQAVAQREADSPPAPRRERPTAGATSPSLDLPLLAHMFGDSHTAASAAASAEWERTRSVTAAVRVLSLQLSGPRTPEVVEAVLAGTSLRGAEVWEELAFRFLASRWRLVTGAGVEAATDALLRDLASGFAYRPALDSLVLGIRIEANGPTDDDLPPLRVAARSDGVDGFVARLVLAFAMIVGGRGVDALVELDAAPPPGTPRPVVAQQEYARGLALYAAGRLEEAEAWASAHLEACLADIDRDALVGHAYVAVMARAALGRFEEAFETAQLVLATGVEAGQLPFAPDRAILTVLAFVAIRTGRTTAAHALAERASALPGCSDGIPFGTPALVAAARRSAEGYGEEAADEYRGLAEDLRARGYVLAAETLEMIALLAHYDPAAPRPAEGDAGGAAGGELFRAWIAGAQAQRDDDPDALVDASRVLRRFGARDQALKLLGHAARLYRLREDEAAGERTQEELRELLDDSLHSAGGAIEEFGLTDREAEIVQGIAEGLSNVEIAARLGVSIRTIDSHLRNIRQKTGTVEREDLARIAGRVTS